MDVAEFTYPDVGRKVNAIQGDVCDVALLNKVMKDVDIVVHCAAALPLYSREEIFDVNVNGTKNV